MMSSKPHKQMKRMRGSPIRKDHMLKKSVRSNSPLRSSRPPPMKRLSPGMKREHLMPSSSKSLHSSRIRSIASAPHRSVPRHRIPSSPPPVDRDRSFKRSKYEKKKIPSISPVRHPPPLPIAHNRRSSSPYQDEKYFLSSRPVVREDLPETRIQKKKSRREPERFPRSQTPNLMRKSNDIPFISDSDMPLRSEIISHTSSSSIMNYLPSHGLNERDERSFRPLHSPPPVSNNLTKRLPSTVKNSYDTVNSERYKSDLPNVGFPSGNEKQYGVTLNERFSSVEITRTEPRIRYSREDLEKITIDIRRNLKEPPPTMRQIVNPNDVKLVRRADEGHRPIFDREEIKQASRDLREDAYYEKKVNSEIVFPASHSSNLRDMENYEITRHRFDHHQAPFHSSSNRSLSDRWQNPEVRKETSILDRDEREKDYEVAHPKKNFVEVRNRSKSGDRDFRSERYSASEMPRSRSDYRDGPIHAVPTSSEPRSEIIRHKESHPESRRRLGGKGNSERVLSSPPRSESRNNFYPHPEKRFPESFSSREKHPDRRSPVLESHKLRPRSRSRGREEKLSEYSRRPDKYSYKSWPDKRSSPPPSSSYYQSRDTEYVRGRGTSKPFRSSRGYRGRGFRGSPRGSFRGRGRGSFASGYKNSSSLRGRGAPRRGRYSPHLWEHDMYNRLSPDRK